MVGACGIGIPVTRSAGVETIFRSGGATVESQLPTNKVLNIIKISAKINLNTEGKSDFIIHLRCRAPNPIRVIVKNIFSKVIKPYLLCQEERVSSLVQAVAAPVITTVIALHRANSLNLGSAISFCSLLN
jgi:hypothetical protein